MSAELQMSSAHNEVDFPYRAISRAAIVSIVLAILSLPGLNSTFIPMLALSVVGILAGSIAIMSIRKYPNEFSGSGIAKFGILVNAVLLVGGVSYHIYDYMTEVPEGYTRVPFYQLQQEINQPTELASEIDGKKVFIKGYIHPTSGSGLLRRFILVPDLGTCCFGGQPKSTDMIEVTLKGGKTVKAGLTKRKLAGQFTLNRGAQAVEKFDNALFYRLNSDQVR